MKIAKKHYLHLGELYKRFKEINAEKATIQYEINGKMQRCSELLVDFFLYAIRHTDFIPNKNIHREDVEINACSYYVYEIPIDKNGISKFGYISSYNKKYIPIRSIWMEIFNDRMCHTLEPGRSYPKIYDGIKRLDWGHDHQETVGMMGSLWNNFFTNKYYEITGERL